MKLAEQNNYAKLTACLAALIGIDDPETGPVPADQLADMKHAGLIYVASVLESIRRSGQQPNG